MKKNKYIALYEAMCPDDVIGSDDARRDEIVEEMKTVIHGTMEEALQAVEWWGWEEEEMCKRWIRKARKVWDGMKA